MYFTGTQVPMEARRRRLPWTWDFQVVVGPLDVGEPGSSARTESVLYHGAISPDTPTLAL